jgi:hypothetical protein
LIWATVGADVVIRKCIAATVKELFVDDAGVVCRSMLTQGGIMQENGWIARNLRGMLKHTIADSALVEGLWTLWVRYDAAAEEGSSVERSGQSWRNTELFRYVIPEWARTAGEYVP